MPTTPLNFDLWPCPIFLAKVKVDLHAKKSRSKVKQFEQSINKQIDAQTY